MKILTSLLMLLCCGQILLAQNTELFVIYTEDGAEKKVFSRDKETNKAIFKTKPNTTEDDFFDAFIIKPSIENPNTVYIISANENNLFLKRTGNELEFAAIQEATTTERKFFEWEILYGGYPYVTINNPHRVKDHLDDYIAIDPYNDEKVSIIPIGNYDPLFDLVLPRKYYRFKISKIENTF